MKRLLVDARPLTHPTAGGRGIGNHVAGILEGLGAIGAPAVALVEHDDARQLVPDTFPADAVEVLSRATVRRYAEAGTWFLATSMYLHPISLDPIPQSVTEARLPVAALLYDVIPYRYPAQYLVEDDPSRQARLRAVWARTVDVHCANSQFVARTAVDELGIDAARIRVVGASANARFRPAAAGASSPRDSPYVVSITGYEDRKNTEGLLRAWGRVDTGLRATTMLVVVATPPAPVLERWKAVAAAAGCSDRVEFATGRPDDEVVALLQHAVLNVVPSLEEGFGLPVLEGAACGVPVICSRTTSLPEVLAEPAAHFDPTDPDDIARAIERGITDQVHRRALRAAAALAVARWHWDRVVRDIVSAIDELGPRWPRRIASPVERYAVRGSDPAVVDATVADLRGRHPGAVVMRALDSGRTSERVPFDGATVPAGALGRYVKPHDLDAVLDV
ncbi:MAG TPA: glycosyltransferase family 1 protein [Ilumatobacteraceae bacterium]|nr:glycosyltransferase family 1 protein [Ilumatobacteraceae bacterium]